MNTFLAVLLAVLSGGRVLGRLRFGWMDGVKVALTCRGMMVEAARQCVKDRKAWRALVCRWLSFTWSFLLGSCVPNSLWKLSIWRRVGRLNQGQCFLIDPWTKLSY